MAYGNVSTISFKAPRSGALSVLGNDAPFPLAPVGLFNNFNVQLSSDSVLHLC